MVTLIPGDCLEQLKSLSDNSVDSLITDPPAGIFFMGKDWDSSKGGRDSWIAWMSDVMRECLRVLKPGAHGLVWSLPRTSHWTGMALENAGFEVRDTIAALFGSGFPKSTNVLKQLQKNDLVCSCPSYKSQPVGQSTGEFETLRQSPRTLDRASQDGRHCSECKKIKREAVEGLGSALKPAQETWWLIRKPLEKGLTISANVLKWGCGGINIDGCRIQASDQEHFAKNWDRELLTDIRGGNYNNGTASGVENKINAPQGRFPANLLLSHTLFCEHVGEKKVRSDGGTGLAPTNYKLSQNKTGQKYFNFADADGTETVEAWNCTDDCPVRLLDEQSGELKSGELKGYKIPGASSNGHLQGKAPRIIEKSTADKGGASRFFYCAKASKSERNAGLEGMPENHHPTVKPQKLMQYLITLITPPNGTVLDPFMGSGSTGVAAKKLGFKFIGIEREKEYMEIAQKRIG